MIELTETLRFFEAYDITLVVVGLGVLGLAALLHRFEDRPFSFPILALALGYVAFALPLGLRAPDPREHGVLAVHLTEIGVIVSLLGVGLKIDRIPNWRTWSPTWRLLAISMPLTIAGVALLGWWVLGLAPAAAVLLGAAMAPTDPVLASDVQVGEPHEESKPEGTDDASPEDETEKEDELRFTLTSEAGLNDSLAFPFTYLALLMSTGTARASAGLGEWLLVDVAYRLTVGVGMGVAIGWLLSHVLFKLPVDTRRDRMNAGLGALAATLLLYGLTELVGGYGFLATFVGALTLRHYERAHESHISLHAFSEQIEQLLMTGTLIAVGGAIAGGVLEPLTWRAALVGLLLLFVVRPVAGLIGLVGEKRLSGFDRVITSFYGIRGIGCIYYLAYGLEKGAFPQAEVLWAVCIFTIAVSVCVHGVTAAPVLKLRDRRLARDASANRRKASDSFPPGVVTR